MTRYYTPDTMLEIGARKQVMKYVYFLLVVVSSVVGTSAVGCLNRLEKDLSPKWPITCQVALYAHSLAHLLTRSPSLWDCLTENYAAGQFR